MNQDHLEIMIASSLAREILLNGKLEIATGARTTTTLFVNTVGYNARFQHYNNCALDTDHYLFANV